MSTDKPKELPFFWPMVVVIIVSILAAVCLTEHVSGTFMTGLHYFMGIYLLFLATLKLFTPKQFAVNFNQYDVIGQKISLYGYFYPVIELFLALAFLANFIPFLTYIITTGFMAMTVLGIFKGIRAGETVSCLCLGSSLKANLSTICLVQYGILALLSFILIIYSIVEWF